MWKHFIKFSSWHFFIYHLIHHVRWKQCPNKAWYISMILCFVVSKHYVVAIYPDVQVQCFIQDICCCDVMSHFDALWRDVTWKYKIVTRPGAGFCLINLSLQQHNTSPPPPPTPPIPPTAAGPSPTPVWGKSQLRLELIVPLCFFLKDHWVDRLQILRIKLWFRLKWSNSQ